jgi:hypothetical protein
MTRFQPGTFVLDVAAALRGEEFGPYKVVAEAGPSSIHARLPDLGCAAVRRLIDSWQENPEAPPR